MDEFNNKVAPEFNPQVEHKPIKEQIFAQENKAFLENVPVKENLENGPNKSPALKLNKEKKNHALSVMSAGVVGAVGLALAGITNLVNVKMKASFSEVEYIDGKISYKIDVSDFTEKETLTIYPSRDKKAMEPISLVDDDGDGIINGEIKIDKEYIAEALDGKENASIEYVLALKGVVGLDVERSFDRWVISIDKYTSKFEDVTGHCNCGFDGYYYFKMNFEDDKGIFSDFEAYITDAFYENSSEEDKPKHISKCVFSDNLHEEQRIYVFDLGSSQGKLVIKYKVDGVETYVKGESGNNWIDINM